MRDWTPSEWATFFIALGTLVNTVLIAIATFLAALAKLRSDTNTIVLNNMGKDVRKVEVATNSMKDALIAGALKEGFAAGAKSKETGN